MGTYGNLWELMGTYGNLVRACVCHAYDFFDAMRFHATFLRCRDDFKLRFFAARRFHTTFLRCRAILSYVFSMQDVFYITCLHCRSFLRYVFCVVLSFSDVFLLHFTSQSIHFRKHLFSEPQHSCVEPQCV